MSRLSIAVEELLELEEPDARQVERLFSETPLPVLALAADVLRQRQCGELVTFVVDTTINYTNICTARCAFCAFHVTPGSDRGYLLSTEEVLQRVERAVRLGATQVLVQGGLNPEVGIEYCEELLRAVAERFPQVHRHFFSPSEVVHLAKTERCSVREVLERLREAGLQSLPGGGAEILDDSLRSKLCPGKAGAREWLEVMRTAHSVGIPSTATMVFGLGESLRSRAEHLLKLRELQAETGGFTAFIPWSFKPGRTALEGRVREAGGTEYLKTVAVSRLVLGSSFRNIQASWLTQGERLAQLALSSGANDFGGTVIEEKVVSATGHEVSYLPQERIVRLVKQLSRPVAQRDTFYRILRRF